jgi:hypothetical protein
MACHPFAYPFFPSFRRMHQEVWLATYIAHQILKYLLLQKVNCPALACNDMPSREYEELSKKEIAIQIEV